MKRETKFIAVLTPIMAILLILMIVAETMMSRYSGAMDSYFGSGEMVIKDSENLDADYYDYKTSTTKESKEYAEEVNNEIVGEGLVMLKNQDHALPLQSDAKITFLGVNTLHYIMGPSDDPYTNENAVTMQEGFEAAGFKVNPATLEYYDKYSQANSSYTFDELMELNPETYSSEVVNSYGDYHDAAIVSLRRATGEGTDPAKDLGAGENNRTKLSLSETELQLINHACQNFDKVIILVMSPNTMELGFLEDGSAYTDPYTGETYDFSNIKGALWVGGLGLTGTDSLAKVLNGEINPSGRLVDTYARNLKADPTYNNVGLYEYTNTTSLDGVGDAENYYCLTGQAFTVEYEEGIYVGYRYYETAAYEAERGNYEGFNYDNAVIYPFGYGLSYTDFNMEYEGTPEYDEETEEFVFKVKVTNTGDTAGKQVVQIYGNAPYDYNSGIEKAQVVLCGFVKTSELQPGESETVEVRAERDYLASYDYKNAQCYIFDEGDYHFYLSDNSHSWADIEQTDSRHCYTWHQDGKIEFKEDGQGEETKRTTDEVAATNRFDEDLNWKFKEYTENEQGSGYATNFTRANFKDSFPTSPVDGDLVANDYVIDSLKTYKPDQGDEYPIDYEIAQTPVTGEDHDLQLVDMRGVDYDDPLWDDYISQFTVDELTVSFGGGGWTEYPMEELGVPYAYGCDGPAGLYSFVLSGVDSYYPYFAEVVLAATFNTEMATLYGDAIGEEAQAQRTATNSQSSITYMFGPGADTHRSAFGGRNYEYYSEDGYLSGKICAYETSAAAEKGVVTLVKHCALNEQETARQGANGSGSQATYTSFCNEQALREIYMKPWEIYAKEAAMTVKYYEKNTNGSYELKEKETSGALAIMTSYNRIGGIWAGASQIISGILREECGFTGTSYTDAGGTINGYMNTDYGLHTQGTDVCLLPNQSPEATLKSCLRDKDSDTTIYCLKEAAKRCMYNKANSNAMLSFTPGSTITYTTAPWRMGLNIAWAAVVLLELAGAALIVIKLRKRKEKQV